MIENDETEDGTRTPVVAPSAVTVTVTQIPLEHTENDVGGGGGVLDIEAMMDDKEDNVEEEEEEEEILFTTEEHLDPCPARGEDCTVASAQATAAGKGSKAGALWDDDALNGFWARQFKRMARKAWFHFLVATVLTIAMSAVAMTVGGFEVAVDNAGWQSRGTSIADRQTQLMLTVAYQDYLFSGGSAAWADLLNNVQPGWETNALGDQGDEDNERRRLALSSGKGKRALPFHLDPRLLQENEGLEGCDVSWYTNWTTLEEETHLWPIWRSESREDTIMDPDLLRDLCVAESNTQKVLETNGLCFGCEKGCLPPYSIALYARLVVPNGFNLGCDELAEAWAEYRDTTIAEWTTCVADLKKVHNPKAVYEVPESCPSGFSPTLVEENFDLTSKMMYSSSIFATLEEVTDEMYNLVDSFDRGSAKIYGAYDTQYEDFNMIYTDSAVGRDMALACGSAFITTVAMIVHTRR
jgi:hypothetical protein